MFWLASLWNRPLYHRAKLKMMLSSFWLVTSKTFKYLIWLVICLFLLKDVATQLDNPQECPQWARVQSFKMICVLFLVRNVIYDNFPLARNLSQPLACLEGIHTLPPPPQLGGFFDRFPVWCKLHRIQLSQKIYCFDPCILSFLDTLLKLHYL